METFRGRGRVLFLTLTAVALIAGVLVVSQAQVPSLVRIGVFVDVGLGIAVFVTLAEGLRRGRPWADSATVMACAILIATGLIRAFVDLTASRLTIPLEAIGAVIVLRAKPPGPLPPLAGRDVLRRNVVIAALSATFVAPFLLTQVGSAGILGASQEDLEVDVTVTCPDAPSRSTPITAAVGWSWEEVTAVTEPDDHVILAWQASGEVAEGEEAPSLVMVGDRPGAGVHAGWSTGEIEAYTPRGMGVGAWPFGLETSQRGLFDSTFAMDFVPPASGRPGAASFWAIYVHRGGVWVEETSPVTCEW